MHESKNDENANCNDENDKIDGHEKSLEVLQNEQWIRSNLQSKDDAQHDGILNFSLTIDASWRDS